MDIKERKIWNFFKKDIILKSCKMTGKKYKNAKKILSMIFNEAFVREKLLMSKEIMWIRSFSFK